MHVSNSLNAAREITLREEVLVHENPWWMVFFDHVVFPSGAEGRHMRLTPTTSRPGAVAVVLGHFAVGTRVALVSQWRYAQQARMWEFPRGFADDTDQSSAETAAREVAEETGLRVVSSRLLGEIVTDSSIIASTVNAFLVETEGDAVADGHEVGAVTWVSVKELLEMCSSGALVDSFTLSAIGLLLADADTRALLLSL